MSITAIDVYHRLYENARIWENNTWLGISCWKLPLDAFVIQELIIKNKPDFIIETGTGLGGSALFYASICELIDNGKVITVELKNKADISKIQEYKCADRIEFIYGGSTNQLVVDKIFHMVKEKKCMVILDSWHTKQHVYDELNLYSKLVPVGGYIVVEDSHVNGNPVPWKWDDEGPMGAIDQWLEENGDKWEVDYECEKHLLTFNPSGYLRRMI